MLLSLLGLTTVTPLFLAFLLSNFPVFNLFKTALPVLPWKNASATMSLHSFKNFTGFLSLFPFNSNLQFLPSASLTILSQFTSLVPSLSINRLAYSVLLLKSSLLSLLHLYDLLHLALSLPLYLGSGILSLLILEISLPFNSSNPVSKLIVSN